MEKLLEQSFTACTQPHYVPSTTIIIISVLKVKSKINGKKCKLEECKDWLSHKSITILYLAAFHAASKSFKTSAVTNINVSAASYFLRLFGSASAHPQTTNRMVVNFALFCTD